MANPPLFFFSGVRGCTCCHKNSRNTSPPCLTRLPRPEVASTMEHTIEVVRCQSVPSAPRTAWCCGDFWRLKISPRTHADQNMKSDCTSLQSSRHTHTPCLTRLPRPEIAQWSTPSKWSDANRRPSCVDFSCVVLICSLLFFSFFAMWWSAYPAL